MISNLSIEEREKLADLYEKLKEAKKSQSELNILTEPLNAELDNLEKQEKDYDLEYSELFESQKEEDIERLANITAEMVKISKRKLEIKKKLDEYEPDFEKNNSMAKEYSKEIDHITNVGVFGEGVVHLDEEGKVIKPESEIKVEIQEFKRPEKEPVITVSKNQIIETKKNVADFIKEKFNSVKSKIIELEENVEKAKQFISDKKEQYKETYNRYYEEEDKKVNQIIEDYKNKQAKNAKAEEEAENIEFYEGDKKDSIEDAMYIENEKIDELNSELEDKIEEEKHIESEIQEPLVENVAPKEENNELFKNADKNDIELHNMQRGNNDIESFETVIPEKKATVSNENMSLDKAYGEGDQLFKNIDKNDEELKQMSQNNYNNIIQVISEKKNRVATAKPSKIPSMVETFNKLKEKIDAIVDNEAQKAAIRDANNRIISMKKEELEKAKERLKEQEKLNYANYQNSINEINNMGMAM